MYIQMEPWRLSKQGREMLGLTLAWWQTLLEEVLSLRPLLSEVIFNVDQIHYGSAQVKKQKQKNFCLILQIE